MSRRASAPTPLPRSRLDEVLRVGAAVHRETHANTTSFAQDAWDRMKEKKQAMEEKRMVNTRLAQEYVSVCYEIAWLRHHKEYKRIRPLLVVRDNLHHKITLALIMKEGWVRLPSKLEIATLGRDLVLEKKPPTFADKTWMDAKKVPPYPELDDGSIARVFWKEVKKRARTRARP